LTGHLLRQVLLDLAELLVAKLRHKGSNFGDHVIVTFLGGRLGLDADLGEDLACIGLRKAHVLGVIVGHFRHVKSIHLCQRACHECQLLIAQAF